MSGRWLRLSTEDRVHSAHVLIESLDARSDSDPAWLEEAQRRAHELRVGTMTSIPAATALANARRRLAG